MTTLLAIETSTELASVALLINETLIFRELSGVQTHSDGILPAIQNLLSEANLALKQCDGIAFGCGPGAFTGVRTACGIVQGLAFGADLPIFPVVSLHAMAYAARQLTQGNEFVCILDARMGEVYSAQYRFTNSGWQALTEPSLSTAEHVLAQPYSETIVLAIGNGVEPILSDSPQVRCMPHAESVARLAMLDFQQGNGLMAMQAQPLYVRNKIALTTAERLQKVLV